MQFHTRTMAAAFVGAAALVAAGCVSDSEPASDEPSDETLVPIPAVAAPPERLTPFCQAMIELSDRLETDPPDDVRAVIIETYTEIADEAPDEIAEEFAAVLAALRSGGSTSASDPTTLAATTTAPRPITTDETGATVPLGEDSFDEGYLPDDDPSRRVNAYVQLVCRGSETNPGPPATQPLEAPPDTTEG